LLRWRQQLCEAASVFSPVTIAAGPGVAPALATPGAVEIEFASGARMRLMGPVEASTVKAVVATLVKAKRR
jgi:transposase